MRIVHLDEWAVARIDGHLHAHQGLQPVRVWHPSSSNGKPEASCGCVNVKSVLHNALLSTQEHDVEGGIPGWRNHLDEK